MEVSNVVSCTLPYPRRMLAPSASFRPVSAKRPTVSASASISTAPHPLYLKSSFSSTSNLGAGDFSGHTLRLDSIDPASSKRKVDTYVRRYDMRSPPPDLVSYLFSERIVYLGLPLIPAVTELILAEFLYLQFQSKKKPIYMYLNTTGTLIQGDRKVGYETEGVVVCELMRHVDAPVYTLCVGHAWGEGALLLAAGDKGNRSSLPSGSIMMRQPVGRYQGQATAIKRARDNMRRVKDTMVEFYATHTGKTIEQIEADVRRPKYFTPSEAIEYGIIDKILYPDEASRARGLVKKEEEEYI